LDTEITADSSEDQSDPIRKFNAEERKLLTEQLFSLTERIHSGELSSSGITPQLLCSIHRSLFGGVRDHAGKMRSRGWGQEHLTFGPNRSSHRNDVAKEVSRLCEHAELNARDLLRQADAADYEEQAMRFALKCHADFIKIHPFEDGNGRTSRLLLTVLLVRLGLRPIPIEAPKREYTDALNQYFLRLDVNHLFELYLRLA
jgi:fido (protein-threonine AMPylation protein)